MPSPVLLLFDSECRHHSSHDQGFPLHWTWRTSMSSASSTYSSPFLRQAYDVCPFSPQLKHQIWVTACSWIAYASCTIFCNCLSSVIPISHLNISATCLASYGAPPIIFWGYLLTPNALDSSCIPLYCAINVSRQQLSWIVTSHPLFSHLRHIGEHLPD